MKVKRAWRLGKHGVSKKKGRIGRTSRFLGLLDGIVSDTDSAQGGCNHPACPTISIHHASSPKKHRTS